MASDGAWVLSSRSSSPRELLLALACEAPLAKSSSSKCSWDGHALGLEAELEGVQHCGRSRGNASRRRGRPSDTLGGTAGDPEVRRFPLFGSQSETSDCASASGVADIFFSLWTARAEAEIALSLARPLQGDATLRTRQGDPGGVINTASARVTGSGSKRCLTKPIGSPLAAATSSATCAAASGPPSRAALSSSRKRMESISFEARTTTSPNR
mmetsp:Transcript_69476/g.109601  ORF Transcript_69476/g.109601 Transcript_69476/m.109601 type:complete len:213 (-) Transcript_69476:42-680(-)